MNKMAGKVVPLMNPEEVNTLILSHYEGESQTLTSDAEANLLRLKEIAGFLNEQEEALASNKRDLCEEQQIRNAERKRHLGSDVDTIEFI
jgi:hypothetical protein